MNKTVTLVITVSCIVAFIIIRLIFVSLAFLVVINALFGASIPLTSISWLMMFFMLYVYYLIIHKEIDLYGNLRTKLGKR